ncbi:MAG: efflux RND transporter periplasmic adaptor subunit [Gemmatimonadota bacterium]|nr:efflux RND transporter periplasmic adaptor subunit [Gemmatimonadota bacterium]MDE2985768.1 efflux RND transporter periplasmic adaptor subunit [Gemmatimonadota bacterium]
MKMRAVMPLLVGVAGVVSWGCGGTPDSGEAVAPHDPHGGGGSFTRISGDIELFVHYPHQIAGLESEEPWEIYVTRVDGWQPVADAGVTLIVYGPPGGRQEIEAVPETPGLYMVVPTMAAEGHWHAEVALSLEGRDRVIGAGEFEVFASEEDVHVHAGHGHAGDEADAHAGHDHAHDGSGAHAGHDHSGDQADTHAGHVHEDDITDGEPDPHAGHGHAEDELFSGLITLPKQEQWSFPFAVAAAGEREIPASIPAPGELVAPPGGLVHVSSPVAGRIAVDGPPIGPGDRVRAGQTLALIAPTSLDNSYVRTRADVVEAQLEADRAERLFTAGAIPQRRVLEARRNLDVAVAAFEAIGGTLDSVGEDEPDPDLYYLRSPIDGVVTMRDVPLGAQVEGGEHAFTIVNASTLWFVARVPARYASETHRIRGAWFTVEGGATAYTSSRVLSIGTMIDPSSRTLAVRFGVPNYSGALKVGMLAEAHILLDDPVPGVAVPASAIQDENNLPVIYVMLSGDTFERRVVTTGPSDGSWTIVSSGIASGEHVVTVGAYQVNLAALGVVAPAHDHAH